MNQEDPKVEFKEVMYTVTEYIIEHSVSGSAQKLINNYFNTSRGDTTLDRAIEAIERYTQENIYEVKQSPKLKKYLDDLAYWAKKWDAE